MLPLALSALSLASGAPNPSRVTPLVAAAERAPVTPELARSFIDGLLAPGVGALPEACAAGLLTARTTADPNLAATAYADALRDRCPPTCAARLFATGSGDVVEVCDAAGPDPLFGSADLRGLRAEMDGMDYLMARTVVDPVLAAAQGTPLGARLEALRPTLARSLVTAAAEARSVGFGPTEVRDLDETEVGFAVSALQPRVQACVQEARREGMTATGTFTVAALVDAVGRVLPTCDGPEALTPVLICVDQVLRTADRMSPPSGDDLGRFSFEVTLSAWPSP